MLQQNKYWLACLVMLCAGFLIKSGFVAPQKKASRHTKSPSNRTHHHPSWPALPSTPASVRKLFAQFPMDAPDEYTQDEPTAYNVSNLLFRTSDTKMFAGWRKITEVLQQSFSKQQTSYLLWGTAHDSIPQFTKFARLLGGTGVTGVTDVIIEMLYADGRWPNIKAAKQQGDGKVLQDIAKSGSQKALRKLHKSQRRLNYEAWKHRYVDEIVDFTLFARGHGFQVHGCEMPLELQSTLKVHDEQRLRVREYHCALANRLFKDDKRQIAMLWGRDHIGPGGIVRFLPHKSRITAVYVFGGGAKPAGLEYGLQEEVKLMEPLLIQLKPVPRMIRYALLLPGHLASKRWKKTRRTTKKATDYNVKVTGKFQSLQIGKKQVTNPSELRLSPGDHVLRILFKKSGPTHFGNIRVLTKGHTLLDVGNKIRIEYRKRKKSQKLSQ